MAATSTPYGIGPASDQTGFVRPLRIPNGINNGLSSNIFKGQPVKLATATGTITPVTATSDKIFGIFQGVEYTPSGGRPAVSPFWPASTTYDTGLDMFVYVTPAWVPGTRFQIQADGAVAQTLFGRQFNFSNLTAGSTSTGLSACTAAAAGANSGAQGQLVLIEFATDIGDTIGDAFTDLIVAIAYPQVVSGFQVNAF